MKCDTDKCTNQAKWTNEKQNLCGVCFNEARELFIKQLDSLKKELAEVDELIAKTELES